MQQEYLLCRSQQTGLGLRDSLISLTPNPNFCALQAGGFIGPTLLGKLSSTGGDYRTAMLVLGAMDIFSAILFLFFRPPPYAEAAADGQECHAWGQELGQPELLRATAQH